MEIQPLSRQQRENIKKECKYFIENYLNNHININLSGQNYCLNSDLEKYLINNNKIDWLSKIDDSYHLFRSLTEQILCNIICDKKEFMRTLSIKKGIIKRKIKPVEIKYTLKYEPKEWGIKYFYVEKIKE